MNRFEQKGTQELEQTLTVGDQPPENGFSTSIRPGPEFRLPDRFLSQLHLFVVVSLLNSSKKVSGESITAIYQGGFDQNNQNLRFGPKYTIDLPGVYLSKSVKYALLETLVSKRKLIIPPECSINFQHLLIGSAKGISSNVHKISKIRENPPHYLRRRTLELTGKNRYFGDLRRKYPAK